MRLCTTLVLFALSTSCLQARADSTGSSVTGGLFFANGSPSYDTTNYFNPSNGFVPAGYDNTAGTTVTIGSGVEFGFSDGANLDTADFSGTTLTITDVDSFGSSPFEMIFTDASFTGFTELTNMSGFSYTFSGHTLDVFYAGTFDMGNTYTASFSSAGSTTPTVTPEPSSLILLGTGALATLSAVRRRSLRST